MSDFDKTRLYADIADRDDTIERQQSEIEMYKSRIQTYRSKLRVCNNAKISAQAGVSDLKESLNEEIKHSDALAAHVNALIQSIQSNCYDDPSQSGKRLMELVEQTPQTSLAEVRAKQAEESFMAGNNYESVSISDIQATAKQHANKIRNGKGGE